MRRTRRRGVGHEAEGGQAVVLIVLVVLLMGMGGWVAAMAGQSLNEFLLARMKDIASVPTVSELAERVRARSPYEGPSAAQAIREDRDRR